jgi:hypothetical protein
MAQPAYFFCVDCGMQASWAVITADQGTSSFWYIHSRFVCANSSHYDIKASRNSVDTWLALQLLMSWAVASLHRHLAPCTTSTYLLMFVLLPAAATYHLCYPWPYSSNAAAPRCWGPYPGLCIGIRVAAHPCHHAGPGSLALTTLGSSNDGMPVLHVARWCS